MNTVPLILAGSLGVIAAAIHGAGGEVLVVRKLSPGTLPPSQFGGPGMTKTMIHVTWHMTTIAFLTVGSALLLAGSVLDGEAAQGIGLVAAARVHRLRGGRGGARGRVPAIPSVPARHPAPVALTATAVLAWWGVL